MTPHMTLKKDVFATAIHGVTGERYSNGVVAKGTPVRNVNTFEAEGGLVTTFEAKGPSGMWYRNECSGGISYGF